MSLNVANDTGIVYLIISAFIVLLAFFFGKKIGVYRERKKAKKKLHYELMVSEAQKRELKKEIEVLNLKLRKYLYFLVRIPEAVKNINSNLSFNDLLSSIIRLTKELIETDLIEIYLFYQGTSSLRLVNAYGSKRESNIEHNLNEGLIGKAAELKMTVSREKLKREEKRFRNDRIEIATPILFKNELIGVIGIGKIEIKTGNEKRLLSMIADLSAVALKNCEYLDITRERAVKDVLTGLYNRRYFFEKTHETMLKSKNYGFTFSIFIFDIDNFKHYNDVHGHTKGDELLKELGKLVKEKTRSTNIIARYGGEEFIVLLENTDKQGAMVYAENIRRLIELHPFPYREKQPLGCVSISGGVATFPYDGESLEEVVRHADEALYVSKKSGKNSVTQYRRLHFSV